jgi:hypothetical protein
MHRSCREAQQLAALALSIQARQRGYLALPPAGSGGRAAGCVYRADRERYAVFASGDADELLTRWQQGEKLQTPCAGVRLR